MPTSRLDAILVPCDHCLLRPGTISDPWSGELLCDVCEENQREQAWENKWHERKLMEES